jgi:hypothetical protein
MVDKQLIGGRRALETKERKGLKCGVLRCYEGNEADKQRIQMMIALQEAPQQQQAVEGTSMRSLVGCREDQAS